MRHLHFLMIVGLMAATVSCAEKPFLSEKATNSLDSLFTTVFPAGEPGGAVLIMKGDEIIYDKGFGLADLNDAASQIDGDSFFNIASCSKQFTAVAVLQLAQKGLINLDDNVNSYLTQYTDPIWDKITIRHMLCHSSGIPDERGYLSQEEKIAGGDDLAVEYLATLDHLICEPGEKFNYSNPGYVLLGKLVEKVSGQPFREYVRENIFTPAGMEYAYYYDPANSEDGSGVAAGAQKERPLIHAYVKNDDGQWAEKDYGETTFFATGPDGGICTSTHELAKWGRAVPLCTVMDSTSLKEAWTPRLHNAEKTWYGYGWGSEGEGDDLRIYHTGGNGGFKTYVLWYPASDMFFTVLANRSDWSIPELQSKVDQIVTGAPAPREVFSF